MLDSLKSQQNVLIDLIVSDDGSTDRTVEIISNYKDSWRSLTLLSGPRKGPAANFAFLMQYAKNEFVAFADQDDIWEPNHLINSINRVISDSDVPCLTFSKVVEFGDSIRSPRIWPAKFPERPIGYFAQNYARGCTMVFNIKLCELFLKSNSDKSIMHDWWMVLLATAYGHVVPSSNAEIKYRIHSSNHTGNNGKNRFAFLKTQRPRKWPPQNQFEIFNSKKFGAQNREYAIDAKIFTKATNGSFKERMNIATNFNIRFRQSIFDEILIRFGFILFPLLFD